MTRRKIRKQIKQAVYPNVLVLPFFYPVPPYTSGKKVGRTLICFYPDYEENRQVSICNLWQSSPVIVYVSLQEAVEYVSCRISEDIILQKN